MASLIFATKCPNCDRSAIEDNYYKIGGMNIKCYRCGYYFSKESELPTT